MTRRPTVPAPAAALALGVLAAAAAAPALAGPDWEEDAIGDAGRLPGSAQVVGKPGGGPLSSIEGELAGKAGAGAGVLPDYQDVYRILIVHPTLFSASVTGGTASFDTQLFLFTDFGSGILGNDDLSAADDGSFLPNMADDGSGFGVLTPGEYLLAITGSDSDPTVSGLEIFAMPPGSTEVSGPDGPAGGSIPFTEWDADGETGTYRIELTGCRLIDYVPPCLGDVDVDGFVGFSDLVLLLADWGPCAPCLTDLDGDLVVGFGDLVILLAAWGPCF